MTTQTHEPPTLLITVAEAARRVGLGRTKVYQLIDDLRGFACLDIASLRVYTPNSSEPFGVVSKGVMLVEELISIPEAANRLGVSETIVRKLTRRGDLTPAKVEQVGQQTRRYYRAGDIEALRRKRSGEVQA